MATPPPYEMHELKHHGIWTNRNPEQMRRLNLLATDLGVSFPMTLASGERQLIFLFGDRHHFGPFGTGRWDEDSIAAAPYEWLDREELPPLRWLEREDGEWLSLIVPGEDLRGMDVPLDGVQTGADVVLFFNADFSGQTHRHGALVCAVAPGGRFDRLERRFRQPSDRFLNVSVSPDPEDERTIWIFGTGHYRESPIYLAKAQAGSLDDFSTWRFHAGSEWAEDEADAVPVVEGRIGELSVRYVPAAESWVMMYQRPQGPDGYGHHIGVYARFSPDPAGPWSDAAPILLPEAETGYTQYLHAAEPVVGFCDGLANPGREAHWGGPYGAYIVPEWSYAENGRLHIVFTLSSWNPYQVHLLEAVMGGKDEGGMKDEGGGLVDGDAVFPPFAEWSRMADPFTVDRREEGEWLVLEGGRVRRTVEWTVPRGYRWLEFEIDGGLIARLYDHTGHRVRESRGPDGHVRKVRWRIDGYQDRGVVFEVVGRRGPEGLMGTMSQPRAVPVIPAR